MADLKTSIRRRLFAHFRAAGMAVVEGGDAPPTTDKDLVRLRHSAQRRERLIGARCFVEENLGDLLTSFASGSEVQPERIVPEIELVGSETRESRLFRLASLLWSVPVSDGYGRRMRFLVWDRNNGKLIGLIALGDPVFNLRVRDQLIGWSASERKEGLVNVMDAYVLGAVPPYNQLLGGKLVASLVRTEEIRSVFQSRYASSKGIISGRKKRPRLLMVTTSSALGRSSLYNRLRLGGVNYFERIGYTAGFGHFHVPGALFEDMREYLRRRGCAYSDGNRFGNGPNWKFRTIRAALEAMGIERDILRHGVQREVFVCRMAANAFDVLGGRKTRPDYRDLLPQSEVGKLAMERWVRPRAERRPEFALWRREAVVEMLMSGATARAKMERILAARPG